MKKIPICLGMVLFILSACTKQMDNPQQETPPIPAAPSATTLTEYTIKKGEHYCDKNNLVAVDCAAMSFSVWFDSTAIYTSAMAENQYDINKLFGFSDNQAHHHEYSARFGWGWSNHALNLYAYVYNEGVRSFQWLGTVPLNSRVKCSLAATGNKYVFTVNGKTTAMPRLAKTMRAAGYKLYPYFGGDEPAPHTIRIRIEEQNG